MFLEFDNRIDEGELEVSRKYLNRKAKHLENGSPNSCLVHSAEEHSKPSVCSSGRFGATERNPQNA